MRTCNAYAMCVCVYVCVFKSDFISRPNLGISEIGFSYRFCFAAPAHREAAGMVNSE